MFRSIHGRSVFFSLRSAFIEAGLKFPMVKSSKAADQLCPFGAQLHCTKWMVNFLRGKSFGNQHACDLESLFWSVQHMRIQLHVSVDSWWLLANLINYTWIKWHEFVWVYVYSHRQRKWIFFSIHTDKYCPKSMLDELSITAHLKSVNTWNSSLTEHIRSSMEKKQTNSRRREWMRNGKNADNSIHSMTSHTHVATCHEFCERQRTAYDSKYGCCCRGCRFVEWMWITSSSVVCVVVTSNIYLVLAV